MGFTAGMTLYKKYKDYTLQQIKDVEKYLEYENNDWAKEHFSSADEYYLHYREDVKELPDKDAVDFYRNYIITDEYGYKHIYNNIEEWCSNGIPIYEFIENNQIGKQTNGGGYLETILSKEDVLKIYEFCFDYFKEHMPKLAAINYAYKYVDTDDEDEPEVKLIPCDGVEITYEENGNTKRIDTNSKYEWTFGFPETYFEESEAYAYFNCMEACVKILAEVDFEDSYVVFEGGW